MIMSAPLSLVFLIYASMLWSPCSPFYLYSTVVRMKGKLQWMSRELTLDAELKVKTVQQYREQYYKSLQFQMADLLYDMRKTYKKMVIFYQQVDRNISYEYLDHRENTHTYTTVRQMGLQIENQVYMVQRWHSKRDTAALHHEHMQSVMRSGINQEYDELEEVPLREVQVRERMARRATVVSAPPPRAPRRRTRTHPPALELGDQRKNKKWRPVRDVDFARRSL